MFARIAVVPSAMSRYIARTMTSGSLTKDENDLLVKVLAVIVVHYMILLNRREIIFISCERVHETCREDRIPIWNIFNKRVSKIFSRYLRQTKSVKCTIARYNVAFGKVI